MKVVQTVKQVRTQIDRARKAKKKVALVPTMGALHEGHMALIERARKAADYVAVSLFLNPAQFGHGEDFAEYPKTPKTDLNLLRKGKADLVFTPKNSEIYPKSFVTYVVQEKLTEKLCGISRPTHFRGVLTVVLKLFNIFQPDSALFGQKDYQQLICIKKMVENLNKRIKIISVPTVRESDGLAYSSRNSMLDAIARKNATCLYRALLSMKQTCRRGEKRASVLVRRGRETIEETPQASVDYLTIVDKESLKELTSVKKGAIAMGAVYLAGTRLIDNLLF